MGKYIYCITEASEGEHFAVAGITGPEDEVTALAFDGVAAVVSESPVKRYRVCRENALAHECTIEAVFARHPVLPVRFCTIAQDESRVRAILEREHAEFRTMLERIRGRMEIGIKAVFQEARVYQRILDRHDEIRRRKQAVASLPPQQAHWQLMEIGKLVEEALSREKAAMREEILQKLGEVASEQRVSDRLMGERMILNAAFLVDRASESEFDRRLNALADRYVELVTFKCVGDPPPFNFVDLLIGV